MNLLRIFHLGARGILDKNHSVPGIVTRVRKSCLYVIKKPVRLTVTEQNTRFSHYITFTYSVNGIPCTGILWLSPHSRCPQKGQQIEVFYDPDKPEHYACYPFGPNSNPIGW